MRKPGRGTLQIARLECHWTGACQRLPAQLPLCCCSLAGFMTEGILAAVKFRNLDGGPRVLGIQNHLWIQVASTVCVALGFLAIFWNKVLHGKVHFKSLHGKVRRQNR